MDKNDILDYVTETPGNTNRAVLGSMLDSIGGGSSLPEVTAADNGDVLTVVNGAWDKASPSGGGGGNFVVTLGLDEQTEQVIVDKTYAQIKSAIESGQNVVLNDPAMTGFVVPLTGYDFREDYENIHFSLINAIIADNAITSLNAFEVNITKDSVVSFAYGTKTLS